MPIRLVVAYVTVLVAAATPWLEVLLVVPAGIIAGLPPAPVVVVAIIGNVATLVPTVLGGDRLRRWWRRRRPVTAERGARRRARHLFQRYGLPGLALLGPLVTGIHVAAIVAIAAGADRQRTLLWLAAGVAAWAVVVGVVTSAGIDAFVAPDALPDLFGAP